MSKASIKQIAIKNALRIWQVKSIEQLDPIVRLFIEVFSTLINDGENQIDSIKERLLEQLAHFLTPDTLISARPAHAVMTAMPVEPETEIGRRDLFFTNQLTGQAKKYGLKHLTFAPVTDHIKLVKGEIQSLLCERNLYRINSDGEKDLITRATSFYQDLNRTVWLGVNLDSKIKTLKNIHFYFDFPNTDHRWDLFELLNQTVWTADEYSISVETSLANAYSNDELYGGIFSHYNISYRNDEEVMELYRKQFLHIRNHVQLSKIKKTPFPEELKPFFSARVNDLEPQYWIKIVFSPFFRSEDLEDLQIFMNAYPVSNKVLKDKRYEWQKDIAGVVPLEVSEGEYFLSVDYVDDSEGRVYNFLPYSTGGAPLGGTYSVKHGGLERINVRELSDKIEDLTDLFRSEIVTFNALKADNIRNSVSDMKTILTFIGGKMEDNSICIKEIPTYLVIDTNEKQPTVYVSYILTNCDLANGIPYGAVFNPLKSTPIERDSCMLLKSTDGGRQTAKNSERLEAYKYALTTRDQLYSAADIENYCRVKFADKIQYVKVKRGVAVGHKQKDGLIRTVDVHLVPSVEYKDILFDPVKQGELKVELEKRSPQVYNYRILVMAEIPY